MTIFAGVVCSTTIFLLLLAFSAIAAATVFCSITLVITLSITVTIGMAIFAWLAGVYMVYQLAENVRNQGLVEGARSSLLGTNHGTRKTTMLADDVLQGGKQSSFPEETLKAEYAETNVRESGGVLALGVTVAA